MDTHKGYPGSKAGCGVWQRIISQMPEHTRYFELFLGSGAVLSRKRLAPGGNVGADLDPRAISAWKRRHRLMPQIKVMVADAGRILSTDPAMEDSDTLVYLDPPYLAETRTRAFYTYEFDRVEQHEHLLQTVFEKTACKVMISGYDSPLYRAMLGHWRRIEYTAMTRGGPRTECLWMNFPAGLPLHDPRWIGDGFRERERIKRKRERWRRRFEAMPAEERQVIREALEAVGN